MVRVQFRGSRAELSEQVRELAAVLAGDSLDNLGVMRGFLNALGFAVLSDVKTDFIVKARGGSGEVGGRWPKLAPSTIANRRVGPGDLRNEKIRQRETIRKREEKKAFARFSVSMPEREARRRARIVGQNEATRQTGRTKVQTLGQREVEILRDTSVLFNSLSPGEFRGDVYLKPSQEGGEEQFFEVEPGLVGVGTNVAYASAHQRGTDRIPARPFLPDEDNPVPATWWDRWLDIGNKALAEAAAVFFWSYR